MTSDGHPLTARPLTCHGERATMGWPRRAGEPARPYADFTLSQLARIDLNEYQVGQIEKILGILMELTA